MLRKALLRTAIAVLFVTTAVHAQTLDQTLSGCNGAAPLRTVNATPSTYRSLINGLIPGDRLLLAAGTYTQGLPLWGKHGQAGKCIVIEGPATGSPALFTGSDSWNLISLKDSSYIAIRNLSLDGLDKAGDGVKAEATSVSVHHILIERLNITNFNPNQQRVGISTKCPAWNWVIRHNTISATGTGMYLGDSSGGYEFSNSLVEHNLVYNTIGYNAQFKHQLSRSTGVGAPSSGTTIIRHNVFSKETGSVSGPDVRPNVLVGHWPLSGAGSTDIYQVYGNVFYMNPYESLFQGEGNVALHDNLFVQRAGTAIRFQAQNSVPRRLEIFNNTVVATNTGISITSADPAYQQRVIGNAVFASTPLVGGTQSSNVTNTYNNASTYLNNPMAALGSGLDLYPKTGQLQGTAIDHSVFSGLLDYNRDFNGTARNSVFRGAYSGAGVNPGWTIALAIKPEVSAPPPPANVLQSGVPVTGISGAHASEQFWTMSVPSGAASVHFQIAGGTGDADLYVRYGSAPTLTTWDCRPYAGDSNELCSFNSPAAGTWHVMLVGDGAYSGVTLTGTICTSISDVEPNNSFSGAQVLTGSCNQVSGTFLNDATNGTVDWFRVSLPAGRTVTALLNGLTQDYDLEIYDGAGNYVAWSYACCTNPDQASWTNTTSSAMNVHIQVYRPTTRPRTTYQLRVSY
jgi:hypothetical protein